jgi:profilin
LPSIRQEAIAERHEQGKQGLVVVKTKQAVLLAHHPDTVQTNACVNTVEQLADYLIGVGY